MYNNFLFSISKIMNLQKLNILLADDDMDDCNFFDQALGSLSLHTQLTIVNDGEQLMTYLAQNVENLPDVLFLDLNMPRKNGLKCLREIRSIEKLKDISIAIYSTSSNENDIEETYLNGANIYITKPNDFNMLKQLLYKAVAVTHLYQGNSLKKQNFFLKI